MRVSLAEFDKMLQRMDVNFPRKTTPVAFRASHVTFGRFCELAKIKKVEPVTELFNVREFEGFMCYYQESLEYGVIEVLNGHNEVLETINIYTGERCSKTS